VSLFRWIFPRTQPAGAIRHTTALVPEGVVPHAIDGYAPQAKPRSSAPSSPVQENIKSRRATRREALYGVVRDVMVRASILSGGYKFKVLSLDQSGIKFLVMVDLAPEYIGNAMRLNDIEGQLIQEAHVRCRILVTAVYWRANGAISTLSQEKAPIAPVTQHSRAAPLQAATSQLAPTPVAPLLSPTPSTTPSGVEPVEADEVAAFRQALLSATARYRTTSSASRAEDGEQAAALPLSVLTGFEDTKVPEDTNTGDSIRDELSMSTTQYGSLPS